MAGGSYHGTLKADKMTDKLLNKAFRDKNMTPNQHTETAEDRKPADRIGVYHADMNWINTPIRRIAK